ncbi:hypothetical protein Forpe1208_v013977 [Fusarium oxysporum f. sp. rapae]|uniref:Uncharacterized protein n=1 Tax=Fusarium oxysporum f. sp. rapae TaxID=485398 RepID=A0A8J5TNX1_FUSOX|nr:hypothetical protein Forpe1208_v013977 [Fusarium oxysporum f. sp. rapae]
MNNATSDQKFTIDLSPAHNGRIPEALREKLASDGFNKVLDFFEEVNNTYVAQIMSIMHELIGADLSKVHKSGTQRPGCSASSISSPDVPSWKMMVKVPYGGNIRATRHRARRTPGFRRLSAVLFVAPDVEATLRPLEGARVVRPFAKKVMDGQLDVGEFKEVMGKKWRRREGNEKSDDGDDTETQDSEIERFIWA